MTRRRGVLLGAAAVGGVTVVAIVLAGALRRPPPEQVALEYGRAVYANDADGLWRLISEEDHRAKDQGTFRRQQRDLRGFTHDMVRELTRYILDQVSKNGPIGDVLGLVENLDRRLAAHEAEMERVYYPAAAPSLSEAERLAFAAAAPAA